MKQMRSKLVLVLVLTFLVSTGFSQINRSNIRKRNKGSKYHGGGKKKRNYPVGQKPYYYASGGLSIMNYFGDLSPSSSIASTKLSSSRPGIVAGFGYQINPIYSFEVSLSYGTLYSDDNSSTNPVGESKFRYTRNLHFKNNIIELSAISKIILFPRSSIIRPFIALGLAGFHHNPKAIAPDISVQTGENLQEAGSWIPLQPLGTEGQHAQLLPTDANFGIKPYSLWQVSIPVGVGAQFTLIKEVLDLSFDISLRYLFFDYIDDVSANYVDLSALDSDLARVMSDRSLEPVSARTKNERELEPVFTYLGRNDNNTQYKTVNGYGLESLHNNRGNSENNDFYYVTSIKLLYRITAPSSRRRPRSR